MTTALRLLLVEDSPTDAKLVVHELRRSGRTVTFERVDSAEAMRGALEGKSWDLVISDWSMPGFSALKALAVLKAAGEDLPFIIVSGTIGEESAVEAMRVGAHDYVLKDKLLRLGPVVERALRESKEREARRQVEAALRESEARFRKLSESGIVGIVVADVYGQIYEANDVYLELIGYTREELTGGVVKWSDLTPPELVHLGARAREQLRMTGSAPPWETETLRRDGTRVPILVGLVALEYPKCIAIALDLTERNRAEEARAHATLEARSHQAGRERAEEALRKSEEQLRQAQKMEAVGRLAGGVAHDFNNVLSVILSYGELILQDLKASDPLRADIEEIRKAATRAAGLTRQLLMFSRQQVAEPRVLDLHEVLSGMENMLRRILGEDVDLALRAPEAPGRVHVDPGHIEQVILNLVVNARDAMPTGGKLTLETHNVVLDEGYAESHLPAEAGPYVVLAVTDSGVGMDRETQGRIFEPFFTTKELGKGTGLGLSTVFGIVRQSGGNVWVYSEPGKGTTFKVYLPRVDAEPAAVAVNPQPTTLHGTETILLVDDEEQVRAVVLSVLRRYGYDVIPAADAAAALEASRKHPRPIHLLLTDVVMPQMSGPELANRLSQTRPDLRVLCVSGYTDDSIVRHGVLESGMAFLQKPLTPIALAKKVREILDGDPRR